MTIFFYFFQLIHLKREIMVSIQQIEFMPHQTIQKHAKQFAIIKLGAVQVVECVISKRLEKTILVFWMCDFGQSENMEQW